MPSLFLQQKPLPEDEIDKSDKDYKPHWKLNAADKQRKSKRAPKEVGIVLPSVLFLVCSDGLYAKMLIVTSLCVRCCCFCRCYLCVDCLFLRHPPSLTKQPQKTINWDCSLKTFPGREVIYISLVLPPWVFLCWMHCYIVMSSFVFQHLQNLRFFLSLC